MLGSTSFSKFSPTFPVSGQGLRVVPCDVQDPQVSDERSSRYFSGASSLTFGAWWYPCHRRLGDQMVLHSEDVSSQTTSPVGDDDEELVRATHPWYLFVGVYRVIAAIKSCPLTSVSRNYRNTNVLGLKKKCKPVICVSALLNWKKKNLNSTHVNRCCCGDLADQIMSLKRTEIDQKPFKLHAV